MKKAVCILMAALMLILAATATVNAEVINKSAMKFVQEAVEDAQAESSKPISTNRLYLKMPASWYSDYGVYQGKYYASVYWWEATAAPEDFPGYRMMIDDYAQGVYYADLPEDVHTVIWGNGFGALQSELGTQKDRELAYTADVNIEGAFEGDYDSLPEGTADTFSFDGYIYVIDDSDSQAASAFSERTFYSGSWYAYYGSGCYGSYAQDSDHFTSVAENCLNPDHFDAQGNHIGGAHLTAPVAPDNPPTDPALNGYYIVRGSEPGVIRSENKLYPTSEDGEYYKSVSISCDYRFRIVCYEDGKELDEMTWYPEEGWYNANAELDDTLSGHYYTLYFYPDETGGSAIVLSDAWDYPTATPTEAVTEAPTAPSSDKLYKERLKEQYNLDDFDFEAGRDGLMYYKELTYHCDSSGEVDWALVYCYTNMMNPMEMTAVIGHRVVKSGSWLHPFSSGYGVYDVKNDRFIDASYTSVNELDGFVRVFDEVGTGRLLGDLDVDGEISIIDATLIQRCEANICDYPEDDEFRVTADFGRTVHYYSDFDQDGERSIIDATRLQRYLADIG